MISLQEVSKEWADGSAALRSVSLELAAGEFLALVGKSGCGKTTTLKTINRLVDPSSGRVCVDGKDISETDPVALRRRVGTVFQRFLLFPHMTVAENVGLVPELCGWSPERIRERVAELLELVELPSATYATRFPRELSGGQQQRVGLARALAARPKVLLMDEPFGALDPMTRDSLADAFRRLHTELGLTTLMVTHDMSEALVMADRIAVMDSGRILQVDTPSALLSNPKHEIVRMFVGSPQAKSKRLRDLSADRGP
ncbi:MAG TPA: ATP-binding cassette domain-containing protein [Polyangiaceae bacterium]|nr:ATP-binding cassette domain-containing protein [Polyangiaceae bacterium]